MDQTTRQRMIEAYGQAHSVLEQALAGFPRVMWHFKSDADPWSIHEVVIHITDSEANSYVRCRRCVAEPGSSVMAYDENRWATALAYGDQSAEDALELFRCLRRHTHSLIQTLPESAWSQTIDHPENGIMTLEDWLSTYERHIPDHVAQMERIYQAWRAQQPA